MKQQKDELILSAVHWMSADKRAADQEIKHRINDFATAIGGQFFLPGIRLDQAGSSYRDTVSFTVRQAGDCSGAVRRFLREAVASV